ncbi:MAG: aminotransferase class I/II-fold pyridoxal phosphate-dependent enzyme [Woeseiaceae bacterium]|nr:aminotransferase class I/II-fold pyridoxal phosphate-dependent enzyme [Woeseiaceae bacterium]
MLAVDKQSGNYLYSQVIDLIGENIDSGTLRPGDRLPSLRKMSRRTGVSIPTVRQAYVELERQRRIESRPQSGFYVRHLANNDLVAPAPTSKLAVDCRECRPLMARVYDGMNNPRLTPLGVANPSMAKPAAKTLHRSMKRIMARAEERSLGYAPTLGEPALKRQIAYHYLDTIGVHVEPDNIAITNGAQEALLLALHSVAAAGDVIAVETPTYHGMLELIDSLGMLAIEVETCPEEGVVLAELRKTFEQHPVKACLLSTTLSNPLGVTMPDEDRKRLVAMLEEYDVALVEDDVYGDLHFDGTRPVPAQFLSDTARIMTCGSFSKTAAPGYRIGWIVADERFMDSIRRRKLAFSCSSGLLQQLTLADFMASGDYGRHLKMLRPVLKRNSERMSALIAEHFPKETRLSRPVGASVLWLELPPKIDAEKLFEDALNAGISIAPGQIFSPSNRYTNFIRLNYGHQWSEKTEDAMRWLGEHVKEMARA